MTFDLDIWHTRHLDTA